MNAQYFYMLATGLSCGLPGDIFNAVRRRIYHLLILYIITLKSVSLDHKRDTLTRCNGLIDIRRDAGAFERGGRREHRDVRGQRALKLTSIIRIRQVIALRINKLIQFY
jgi:hypothetical protein